MDAVAAAESGHLGLPLGAAEIGAALFGSTLQYNPQDPKWLNRDRFLLSAGHGSMFLYGWLHLAGYALPLEELKRFRQLCSMTPGHPEFGSAEGMKECPGVEATTGPLGQGVGNAVGMAMSAKMAAARFNTKDHAIFDHHIIALAGDGCLQEGVAAEASSLAGRLGLDNLILIYDSNDVTLDAMASKSQSENTALRYEAYGFDVWTIPGNDVVAIAKAVEAAKANDNGKPKFIICRTLIGKGIPEVAGSNKAHGEAGVKFVAAARKGLGLPEERFYVSPEVRAYFTEHAKSLKTGYDAWQKTFAAWKAANPDLAKLLQSGVEHKYGTAAEILEKIPAFPADSKIATRKAGSDVLQPIAKASPLVISGSADLHGSTLNYIKDAGDYDCTTPAGRNLYFGIREHAMGAILNGFAYHGIFLPSGATFLTFSDYCRPSIRLAALSHLPLFYIFTHDSIGVGEDGPTHQPVETVSALRCIPNLDVIRPADPEETAGAFAAAVDRNHGPTALILSRQAVPMLNDVSVKDRREGVLKGGYIAKRETGELKLILIASGSEVQHAMAAAKELGQGVRVVSMPCMERFDRQPAAYRDEVLPPSCRRRVSIEAGVSSLWQKYVGLDGVALGINRFGMSAPGGTVMKELGMTAAHVVKAAQDLREPVTV